MSNNASRHERWETHTYEGLFSISLPFGICPSLDEDGTLLTFGLSTAPASHIIAGVFPTPENSCVTPSIVQSELQRFMADCAGVDKATYEPPIDFEKEQFVACQAVGTDTIGRWWIARLYGRDGGHLMLLVHWVGHESDILSHVLPVIVTIDPFLDERR